MRGQQGAEEALGRLDRSGLSHTNPQIPESGHMRVNGLDLSTFVCFSGGKHELLLLMF